MNKNLHGAAKFIDTVYNEYGGEENYTNSLILKGRKEGIIATLAIFFIGLLAKMGISYFKKKYKEMVEKRKLELSKENEKKKRACLVCE